MLLAYNEGSKTFRFNVARPLEISIPLDFNGPQPNTYGVAPATGQAYAQDGWIGDVRKGGACNFETYHITPHCNGTHTECVGHITEERIAISTILKQNFFKAQLVTVRTEPAGIPNETTLPAPKPGDRLITRNALQTAFNKAIHKNEEALIVRTLPNPETKLTENYTQFVPPYFTAEAMQWIVDQGFMHLLVDVPSVDRLTDEGMLTTHRIFWQLPTGNAVANARRAEATITEFIFVPQTVPDGPYMLQIQIPAFLTDAAPSRIYLYELA